MANYTTRSDQELLALFVQGDSYAYTEIYERYTYLLYKHAFNMLGDASLCEDVLHDVFLNLWRKRTELTIHTTISAYLYKAVRNRILDLLAREELRTKYVASILLFAEDYTPTPLEELRAKELAAVIEKEIAALPSKMQTVFLLHKMQGLSYKHIAEQLDITDKTAKQQVYNALKILKLKLGSNLITLFL